MSGPVRASKEFRIGTKHDLHELLNYMNVFKLIIIQQLRWLEHAFRMSEHDQNFYS